MKLFNINDKDDINFSADNIGVLIIFVGLFIVFPICVTLGKIFG